MPTLDQGPEQELTPHWRKIDAGSPPVPAVLTAVAAHGRRRRRRVLAGIAATAVFGTGIGVWAASTGGNADESHAVATPAADPPRVDAAVLRGDAEYDYAPFDTISGAVDGTKVAIAGEVTGWRDGRAVPDGTDGVDLTAILEIRVSDPINGTDVTKGQTAYVEVFRGGYVLDENGDEFRNPGAAPAYRTLDEMRKAVPDGVRVIVMGVVAASDAELQRQEGGVPVKWLGEKPSEGVIVTPYPQGLLLETATGEVASGVADGDPREWGWLPAPTTKSGQSDYDVLLAEATH